MKRVKKMLILCCALLYGGAFTGCASPQAEFVEASSSAASLLSGPAEPDGKNGDHSPEDLYVYVCGEVKRPGVYRFSDGARVYEALACAGGLTEAAEDTALNQARLLTDGEEIRVPAKGEAVGSRTDGESPKEEGSDKVNINTADAGQLTSLNGIGPSRAEAIIAWREANGGFTVPEDLKKVDGIADKTFDKLKDEITVR